MGDGTALVVECELVTSSVVPVEKVLVQQQISLMTANAWLTEDKTIEDEVVDLSCT